jgi:hypothetical protein
MRDAIPKIDAEVRPPPIRGTAALAHRAFAGAGLRELLAFVGRTARTPQAAAGIMLDCALANQLQFRAPEAAGLQRQALDMAQVFRVEAGFVPPGPRPLRLLALVAPGDLMVNTPLDFITAHLDVRLDLLFVRPGHGLPEVMPEHDVAFFAVSESDPDTLARLAPLFGAWPRPALNDPSRVARLTRDGVADGLRPLPGLATPRIVRRPRDWLAARAGGDGGGFPLVARPVGSHAGQDLRLIDRPDGVAAYLAEAAAAEFYVADFIDYRGPDGLFRKYRVAFIDGAPWLCHMAASEHWMVHYLNAGMTESGPKRDMEAAAMAGFDTGFAVRHRAALAALDAWIGLDYHQIDCAELPDGRLLVFEADVAAIVHLMDPPELFPYKPAQMRRVMAAFDAMLRRHAGVERTAAA